VLIRTRKGKRSSSGDGRRGALPCGGTGGWHGEEEDEEDEDDMDWGKKWSIVLGKWPAVKS
jgi:hypothetical protein